jgi:pilus assembly protein FimV
VEPLDAQADGQSGAGDESGLIEWSEPEPLVSLDLQDETAGEDAKDDPVSASPESSATTTLETGASQSARKAPADQAEPQPGAQWARQQPAQEEPSELEFSLDDLDPVADTAPLAAATEAGEPAFAQTADLESIEPDFDFPGLAIEGEEEAEPEVQEELDLSEALEEGEVSTPLDLSADRRSDEDEMVFAADSDQMATRLDLARAYLDMGDAEGARPILEEVAASASGEHQAEARELLERINA